MVGHAFLVLVYSWLFALLTCTPHSMGLLFLSSTLPAYAFAYFLALILRGFGYSIADSQLLAAPPYVAAIFFGMGVGFAADKLRMRGPFLIAGALISMTGSLIVGYGGSNGQSRFHPHACSLPLSRRRRTVAYWCTRTDSLL